MQHPSRKAVVAVIFRSHRSPCVVLFVTRIFKLVRFPSQFYWLAQFPQSNALRLPYRAQDHIWPRASLLRLLASSPGVSTRWRWWRASSGNACAMAREHVRWNMASTTNADGKSRLWQQCADVMFVRIRVLVSRTSSLGALELLELHRPSHEGVEAHFPSSLVSKRLGLGC